MKGYLANGQEVEILATIQTSTFNGYLISRYYDVYDNFNDEQPEGEPGLDHTVEFIGKDSVYMKPPKDKIEASIKTLLEQKKVLQNEKKELEQLIADTKKIEADRLNFYKKFKSLENLDKYLTGEITHFVILDYYDLKIFTMEEFKKSDNYNHSEMKLISLFGRSNGDLTWKANEYSDGSGNGWKPVKMCLSREEAEKIALEYLIQCSNAKNVTLDYIIRSAIKNNIQLPDEILQRHKEQLKKWAAQRMANAKEAYDTAIAKFQEITNERVK